MIGFIILRHVRDLLQNEMWIECYSCIRKFYPTNYILIIDDNSKYEFVSEIKTENLQIINSEYPGRAELLPYYYFLKFNNKFDTAIILHDSVFIQKYIDFTKINKYNICLWNFNPNIDKIHQNIIEQKELINNLRNSEKLLKLYDEKNKWSGCFGVMSIIKIDFLQMIEEKYKILNLLPLIKTRNDRMNLERVFGLIISYENKKKDSLIGNIHKFQKYYYNNKKYWKDYDFNQYKKEKKENQLPKVDMIKVFSGR